MLESAMIADVQRGCRNPRLSSSDISAMLLRGVTFLGSHIKQVDPSYFLKRKSLTSLTHVFTKPIDCLRIEKIWDLGTSATAITGASSGAGGVVSIEAADHGYSDDDIVMNHDISGTTEGNGVFKITTVDDDNFLLQGTTFANAWTSGGYTFKVPTYPDEIKKKLLTDADAGSDRKWYPRGSSIIIDDISFTNDILIDYEEKTDSIDDIPDEYHQGLISFCVIQMIRIPDPEDKKYVDMVDQKRTHRDMLNIYIDSMKQSLKASSEPKQIKTVWADY